MIDFLMIATRTGKRGTIEIYPKFIIKKSKDLMIRGSDFYAVWMEERGLSPGGFVANDYSLAVWGLQPVKEPAALLSPDILAHEFVDWVQQSHLLRRAFREVAVISGGDWQNTDTGIAATPTSLVSHSQNSTSFICSLIAL